MKVIAGSLAAFIAGIGGGLLVMAQSTFQPSEFATFLGVTWLAVLVTIGVRSNAAALIAGLAFVFPLALAQYYFSAETWIPNVVPVLFGLGAISAAKYPDGALAENSRRLRRLVPRLLPARRELYGALEPTLDGTDLTAEPVSTVAEQVS
jgi:branched-chain amino acid transport system permease protein